jgi:hypothetical protein
MRVRNVLVEDPGTSPRWGLGLDESTRVTDWVVKE